MFITAFVITLSPSCVTFIQSRFQSYFLEIIIIIIIIIILLLLQPTCGF